LRLWLLERRLDIGSARSLDGPILGCRRIDGALVRLAGNLFIRSANLVLEADQHRMLVLARGQMDFVYRCEVLPVQ
jgi:hypothetical protein